MIRYFFFSHFEWREEFCTCSNIVYGWKHRNGLHQITNRRMIVAGYSLRSLNVHQRDTKWFWCTKSVHVYGFLKWWLFIVTHIYWYFVQAFVHVILTVRCVLLNALDREKSTHDVKRDNKMKEKIDCAQNTGYTIKMNTL